MFVLIIAFHSTVTKLPVLQKRDSKSVDAVNKQIILNELKSGDDNKSQSMDEGIFIEKGESIEGDEVESRTATDEVGGEVIYFIIFCLLLFFPPKFFGFSFFFPTYIYVEKFYYVKNDMWWK